MKKQIAGLLTGLLVCSAFLTGCGKNEATEAVKESVEDENEGTIDLAVFTSASTVKGFVESTKGLDYSRVRAACIGKQTRAAADSYGMQTYMSEKATIDSLIELVETLKRSEEKWN